MALATRRSAVIPTSAFLTHEPVAPAHPRQTSLTKVDIVIRSSPLHKFLSIGRILQSSGLTRPTLIEDPFLRHST